MRTIVEALPPGAKAVQVRSWLGGQQVPRWPAHLRSANPGQPPSPALWPMDPEGAALSAGLRTLLKRESIPSEGVEAEERWLHWLGLVTRRVEMPGGTVGILAAKEESTVQAALEAEHALRSRSEGVLEAANWLGDALGYPPCCRELFLRHGQHDDLTLLTSCLPEAGSAPPASAFTQWICGPLALISHTPCSLECSASIEIARRSLEVIEGWAPGWSDRWLELAGRVHLIDRSGRAFALDVDGSLTTGVVRNAVEIVASQDASDFDIVRPVHELAGAELTVEEAVLRVGALVATIVADHRARDQTATFSDNAAS